MNRCRTYRSASDSTKIGHVKGNKNCKFAYIWVQNTAEPPLVAPNNDVGLDGMVIKLTSLLAGTATNPFRNGYFQGPAEESLETASACPGVRKGLILVMSGTCSRTPPRVPTTMPMVLMEGSTCFLHYIILQLHLVPLWFNG
ncbi:hypothetical protein DVH24_016795 [Malus domestica]|uniref:Uncharacterized protein n=1 Tax=Malus domestica TaxID=3750 RepID=A0A498HYH6_MALDO|nr:hypothetical protein DVH24_016795 [Malus domestica]